MPIQTNVYPRLSDILNLVRVFLNDWQAGVNGTPGEGQITTNSPTLSPQTLPALNSSLRRLYRDLRLVGSPSLIRDNVQITMPANAVNGPNIQTYLSFNGWFDGAVLQSTPVLPPDMIYPMKLDEQQFGSGNPFVPMEQPQFGLPSPFQQGFALQYWEWRGGASVTAGSGGSDALWFIGALNPVTIRIRYQAALMQLSGTVDYANTYIPIQDSDEVVAYRMASIIAAAIGGPADSQQLAAMADEATRQLKLEYVKRQQTVEYTREPYAGDFGGGGSDYGNTNSI